MDLKKIAFITCVNNELEFREAKYYISNLIIPHGYKIDVIQIKEAPSMAAGYNAAMHESDAKYKIYMHQDVFIINRNFIADILRIFESYEEVGMLGCIGCTDLSSEGFAVTEWNAGKIYHNCFPHIVRKYQNKDKTPATVDALDGVLLVTQYDLEWREDIFDGWDFYDISQCFEMKRHGYKVVVPFQDKIWCYHDNAYSKMLRYEEYQRHFAMEYQDVKAFKMIQYSQAYREFELLKEKSIEQLQMLVDAGMKDEIKKIFSNKENRGFLHMLEFQVLSDIDKKETENSDVHFWNESENYDILRQKLSDLRYAVKRIEFHMDEDETKEYIKKHYTIQAMKVVKDTYVSNEYK